MPNNARPYPEGTAWDEAWRERKRADRMAEAMRLISEADWRNAATNCCAAVAVGIARRALENQYGE